MEEYKKCTFCGEEIRAEAIKCKHCGEFLNVPEEQKPKYEPETPKGKIAKIGLIVSSLSCIVLFVIAAIRSFLEEGGAAFPAVAFFVVASIVVVSIFLIIFLVKKISEGLSNISKIEKNTRRR